MDPPLVDYPESPAGGVPGGGRCTESDFLSLRRLRFPLGVARGDLVAFPNTAGYLMHIVETRSHQFPLARNVVVGAGEPGTVMPDPHGSRVGRASV